MTSKMKKRPAWMGTPKVYDEDKAAALAANLPNSQDIRRHAALEGIGRFVRRFERAGQKDAAANIRALAEKAERALTAHDSFNKALAVKRHDVLAVAHSAAAAELQKVLPVCFPSETDALIFARRLPLKSAVKAASDAIDAILKKRREQQKHQVIFWDFIVQAGRLALGSPDDDANIKALVEAGL
jgi:hypothetical protein